MQRFVVFLKPVIFTSACLLAHLACSRTFSFAAQHYFSTQRSRQDYPLPSAKRTHVWPFLPNRARSHTPWRKPRSWLQIGRTSWWRTSAQEEENDDLWEVVSELESRLAAKRLVEAGMDQVRWSFVFACRGAGCSDGNGRKRVQYRLVLCKLFQGSNRERQCWKTDGREMSHTEVVSSTREACRLFVNCSQEPGMYD